MNPFRLAKPIYVKGLSGVMNAQAGFVCAFDAHAAIIPPSASLKRCGSA